MRQLSKLPQDMKRVYQVASTAFLLGAVFVCTYSLLALTYYTRLGPGPGFFPFWLAALLGVLSIIMFYKATYRQVEPMPEEFFPTRAGYFRIGAIVVAISSTVFLMEPLGFCLTMLTFYLVLLPVFGSRNLIVNASVAGLGSFGVYHVFVKLLKIPLPVGGLGT
jgi:putative tricarboxylic transport membrane protein